MFEIAYLRFRISAQFADNFTFSIMEVYHFNDMTICLDEVLLSLMIIFNCRNRDVRDFEFTDWKLEWCTALSFRFTICRYRTPHQSCVRTATQKRCRLITNYWLSFLFLATARELKEILWKCYSFCVLIIRRPVSLHKYRYCSACRCYCRQHFETNIIHSQ